MCVKCFVFIFLKILFEFFPCHFQVVAHRPDGQYRCYKHQYVTNEIERVVIFVRADKQKEDGDHLGSGFEFADSGHCNAAAFAHLCHPFAQGGMVISRPIIIMAKMAYVLPRLTSRSRATATMSLSATGSRNAPKSEVCFQRRAKKPSNQSVIAASAKMIAAVQLTVCG